jgi:hypothetical protein
VKTADTIEAQEERKKAEKDNVQLLLTVPLTEPSTITGRTPNVSDRTGLSQVHRSVGRPARDVASEIA